MVVVIGIVIGLAVGAGVAFLWLYAFAGSRLAAARRTRQLLVTEAKREADALRREAQIEAREDTVRFRGEVEQELGAAASGDPQDRGARAHEGRGHRPEAHRADAPRAGRRRP